VVGCWIAHSRALESITERQGITVVVEDDFICTDDFFDRALKMINSFDLDFDVIVFDPWGEGPQEEHRVSDDIYRPRNCLPFSYVGTQCLFINNHKIPNILESKLNSKIRDYDNFLFANHKINCYVFYTGLSGTRHIGSDIRSKWSVGILGEIWRWLAFGNVGFQQGLKIYRGRYDFRNGGVMNITTEGNGLFSQISGQPRFPIFPSGPDEFFWKVFDAKIRFIRNDKGEVISGNFVNGGKQTNLPKIKEEVVVSVDPSIYNRYVGKYDYGNDSDITISTEYKIFAQGTHQPKCEIFPVSEKEFILKDLNARIIFDEGPDENVKKLTVDIGGQKMDAPKIIDSF
jgi:hypothetical protein